MDAVIDGLIIGAIVGIPVGIIAGFAALAIRLIQFAERCPRCGATLPKIRRPRNLRQWFNGQTTCLQCGCELDRQGKETAVH